MIIEDLILIRKIQNGDKQALDKLIRLYYEDVFSLCFYRCGNDDLAADLCQESFVKLIRNIYQYKPSGKFRNYLYTITLNVISDYYRKQKTETVSLDEYEIVNSHVDPDQLTIEEKETLRQYICCLSEAQKNVILLYYYHGLRIKEIAKILNTNESTVKSRLFQAIKKLKEKYEEEKTWDSNK